MYAFCVCELDRPTILDLGYFWETVKRSCDHRVGSRCAPEQGRVTSFPSLHMSRVRESKDTLVDTHTTAEV